MDSVSLMASEAQYNEQDETIDDWLVGTEFEAENQISDPSAIQFSHSGPANGIGIFDPEHLLDADVFPDLTDFSPRGIDDRKRREKENGSPVQDGTVPSELISIGNGSCAGVPSLHIEPISNSSISVAPMVAQGSRNHPVSSHGLETQAIPNQSSRTEPAGSHDLLIASHAANQDGAGPAEIHPLRINLAAHSRHGDHAANRFRSIQGLSSQLAQVAPDSRQELHTSHPEYNPAKKKRDREKVTDRAEKMAKDVAQPHIASMPPTPSKRRKGGRAASSKTAAKASREGGEASGNASGSAIARGSSSRRPQASRARPGSKTANISPEERHRIRAERNRQSAEKSRLRQKQSTLELEQNVLRLRAENRELKARVDTFRIQLQSASQNLTNGKANAAGDGVLAGQVPALTSAIAAIEQVMQECPRTFAPESSSPAIALSVKTNR